MVYFVYADDCELESSKEFLRSLAAAEDVLAEQSAALHRTESENKLRRCEGREIQPKYVALRREPRKHRARSRRGKRIGADHIPAATNLQDLPVSERRMGTEAIKAICDRGKTHNRLLAKACASVDTREPRTRQINRWHAELRARDPMPELDLPRDIKSHSSWQQLAEIKWRKDWHERLMSGVKSSIDTHLPKHVRVYQRRKRLEMHKLLQD